MNEDKVHMTLKDLVKKIFSIIKGLPKNFPRYISRAFHHSKEAYIFVILLIIFIISFLLNLLAKYKHLPTSVRNRLFMMVNGLSGFSTRYNVGSEDIIMNRLDLFDLAFKNMGAKKSRTLITVGGMALGVATIIFLVTLGYGLQKLVIDRVARLEEVKQADISMQPGSNVRINYESIEDFLAIPKVETVLPLIGLVAKVNYLGSVSDVAVYGVTTKYLESSAIRTIEGKLFDNNSLSYYEDATVVSKTKGQVAGISTEASIGAIGQVIGKVKFSVYPDAWLRVRSGPNVGSPIVGYTKRIEGIQYGDEVWGSSYTLGDYGRAGRTESGEQIGKWVKTKVYIWDQKDCQKDSYDCEDGEYIRKRDEEGDLVQLEGYIAEIDMIIDVKDSSKDYAAVLGVSTESDATTSTDTEVTEVTTPEGSDSEITTTSSDVTTDTASLEGEEAPVAKKKTVDLGSLGIEGITEEDLDYLDLVLEDTGAPTVQETTKVSLPDSAMKQAVVNIAMLNVLGIERNSAVGKTFETSFVVTSDLLANEGENVVSENATYEIVGVIQGDTVPFFYVPLTDLKSLGIDNYSQVKVVAKDDNSLVDIRKNIEALGFRTSSVADTVDRINELFKSVRFVLGIIGAVALSVAALGMFNTLTVSLLERVREIGLMKAMGMTSGEVKRLFLTESMMMGLMGGFFGIVIGFVAGKILSLVLSIFGLIKGVGFIDVVYLPIGFALAVFFSSIAVGIVTGIYPSRRATRISALNALRYE